MGKYLFCGWFKDGGQFKEFWYGENPKKALNEFIHFYDHDEIDVVTAIYKVIEINKITGEAAHV